MPSLFIYAKVVMPIAVMLHRGEGRKRRKKKIVRFADTGLSGTIKASGSRGGGEQWRWHSFRHVYIKSSISVEPTAVSIRVHFVFANGKADKTFNMFKLASISIIYPIRDYLVSVLRGNGGWEHETFARGCLILWFLLWNIEG